LQSVGVLLFREQLQPVINGVCDQQWFRRNAGELWIGKQQLKIRNLRTGQAAVGISDDSREGIINLAVEAGDRQSLASVACVGVANRQALHPRAQEVTLRGAAER